MLAWADGDEAAFERLVHAYSGQVYALLTRFLGPVPQREDLVQDVFLRVVRARDRYAPTARFSTWLYRIVFNLATNEREKLRLRRALSLDGAGDDDARPRPTEPADERLEGPEARLERLGTQAAVRAAIAALPDNQRMALVLAKYDGLPHAEIAQVLGISEKAVKSLVHRARETLRQNLASLIEEEVA
jgi:RNA polymerase sigma-70 factor (ECF subfamily)